MRVGSVCSGIEAASVAWAGPGFSFSWFCETAPFPSRLLAEKYPGTPNLGDLRGLPGKIRSGDAPRVDLICGGTPCQAFSLSGLRRGLDDGRGRLTIRFVEAADANDALGGGAGAGTLVFWENVEGILNDRTNAFGCFVSLLAGGGEPLAPGRWPSAGLVRGRARNVAWRVLDAKRFGLPQQRRRLYVLAGGKRFNPENVLFERHGAPAAPPPAPPPPRPLSFTKGGKRFELFREYTDCLYSAYGTKWNGNAAAYNGSLFVAEDGRLRRFTPLECERLMGFPDDYTRIAGASPTKRYQGIGNSWAVPVVRWIGGRFGLGYGPPLFTPERSLPLLARTAPFRDGTVLYDFSGGLVPVAPDFVLNATAGPEEEVPYDLAACVETGADERFFLSPVGCKGILRRAAERNIRINPRLESVLSDISRRMPDRLIEEVSRRQKRGAFSAAL